MKKYHVYGMGNALLDSEYHIDDQLLNEIGIEKSTAQLIQESELHQLQARLKPYLHAETCAGSAANAMITAAHFGGKIFYSCKVASDSRGDDYYQYLVNAGLHTNLTHDNREPGNTGNCIVLVTPDSERTMTAYLGATATYSEAQIDANAIEQAQYLYIEGYQSSENAASAAAVSAKKIAKQANTKISMTLSDVNLVRFFKSNLLMMLEGGIDLLFCNEQEALAFTSTHTVYDAGEALKKYAKQFVITQGIDGAYLFDGHSSFTLPAHPIKAINTVGAGDTYAGAFLFAITHGYPFEEAGLLAGRAAAEVVARSGARLEKTDILSVLSEIKNTLQTVN